MPFVSRDAGGLVDGVFALPQPGIVEEELPDNSPEVVNFLKWGSSDVEAARAVALAKIDKAAGNKRAERITNATGQDSVYGLKAEEATDCLANYSVTVGPPPGTYKMLDAEVGVTAATTYEVAEEIKKIRDQWVDDAALVEAVRMKAKRDIKGAATIAEIDQIMAAIVWPVFGPMP